MILKKHFKLIVLIIFFSLSFSCQNAIEPENDNNAIGFYKNIVYKEIIADGSSLEFFEDREGNIGLAITGNAKNSALLKKFHYFNSIIDTYKSIKGMNRQDNSFLPEKLLNLEEKHKMKSRKPFADYVAVESEWQNKKALPANINIKQDKPKTFSAIPSASLYFSVYQLYNDFRYNPIVDMYWNEHGTMEYKEVKNINQYISGYNPIFIAQNNHPSEDATFKITDRKGEISYSNTINKGWGYITIMYWPSGIYRCTVNINMSSNVTNNPVEFLYGWNGYDASDLRLEIQKGVSDEGTYYRLDIYNDGPGATSAPISTHIIIANIFITYFSNETYSEEIVVFANLLPGQFTWYRINDFNNSIKKITFTNTQSYYIFDYFLNNNVCNYYNW